MTPFSKNDVKLNTNFTMIDQWCMYIIYIYICIYIYILRCQSCPDFNVGFHVSEPQFFPRWAPYLLLCLQGVALIHELVLRTVRHEIWTGPPFPPRVTIHPSIIHPSIHPSSIQSIIHPSPSMVDGYTPRQSLKNTWLLPSHPLLQALQHRDDTTWLELIGLRLWCLTPHSFGKKAWLLSQ